ncbi:MAG: LacI family DNA-binding transcriptional regulator, partial [Acidobacteriaceae bacterium]|nr:LacI family DNA-binding transcriptional regulator [Acidobacteriaceae bacterium]
MNIRDVAERARVSTATVSRVMSGIDVVKPATVARVRKSVE